MILRWNDTNIFIPNSIDNLHPYLEVQKKKILRVCIKRSSTVIDDCRTSLFYRHTPNMVINMIEEFYRF